MGWWLNGWMVGWLDGWMVGWMDGWMDVWMVGWMDGWMVGWMDGWMEGGGATWTLNHQTISTIGGYILFPGGYLGRQYVGITLRLNSDRLIYIDAHDL